MKRPSTRLTGSSDLAMTVHMIPIPANGKNCQAFSLPGDWEFFSLSVLHADKTIQLTEMVCDPSERSRVTKVVFVGRNVSGPIR
jgi:hypothetical protein